MIRHLLSEASVGPFKFWLNLGDFKFECKVKPDIAYTTLDRNKLWNQIILLSLTGCAIVGKYFTPLSLFPQL